MCNIVATHIMEPAGTIRIFRIQRGLSLRQVAARAQISFATLSRIERNAYHYACSKPDELKRIVESIESLDAERRGSSR